MHSPDTYLLLYRDRVDPDGDVDDAFGHLIALAGAIVGAVGVCTFLVGSHLSADAGRWLLREAGISLAALALPTLLYADVVRLPLRETEALLAGVGLLLTPAAVVLFLVNYPHDWFVPGGATATIALYTTGMALLVAVETVVPLLTDPGETG